MELSMYLNTMEEKLTNNFDVFKDRVINSLCYDLYAEYHLRNEKFFLVRKAVIYAFENNEYILMKYYKMLNKCDYDDFTDNLIRSVKSVINPSRDHMSSVVTGVIIVDSVSEKDLEYIKKSIIQFKYNKSFAFGYKGWAEIRLILVSLKAGLISYNKKGKEVAFLYNFNSN